MLRTAGDVRATASSEETGLLARGAGGACATADAGRTSPASRARRFGPALGQNLPITKAAARPTTANWRTNRSGRSMRDMEVLPADRPVDCATRGRSLN